MTAVEDPEIITKASKSNLALSFISLPRERRRDMNAVYAFCRIVDDIADSSDGTPEEKRSRLEAWRRGLSGRFEGEPALAAGIRALIRKYRIPPERFGEIIDGVEMDLSPRRYASFEELRQYCYRVAGAVGLVSIEVFGYTNPSCRKYAVDLGLALQLTNIIRDVAEDFANGGRIYLPADEMARFGYSADDLAAGRYDETFRELMEFQAERAIGFYESAAGYLPPEDRKAMTAAELMSAVYRKILENMRRDGFRVFEKDYSLSTARKSLIIARFLARNAFGRLFRAFRQN